MADHPILAAMSALRRDLFSLAARAAALQEEIAKLDLPRAVALNCPECSYRLTTRIAFRDHLYNVHGVDLEGEGGGPLHAS